MTRFVFQQKLRRRLAIWFSPQEAEDILKDYEEYFEGGLKSGKTEEHLCIEFGSPREIVACLRAERGRTAPGVRNLVQLCFAAVMSFYGLYLTVAFQQWGYPEYLSVTYRETLLIFALLIPLSQVIWLWSRSIHFAREHAAIPKTGRRWVFLSAHLLQIAAVCWVIILMKKPFISGLDPGGMEGLGYWIWLSIMGASWLTLVIWAGEFLFCRDDAARFFPCCFLNAGVLFSVLSVDVFYHAINFSSFKGDGRLIYICFLPLLCSFLYGAACCLMVRRAVHHG